MPDEVLAKRSINQLLDLCVSLTKGFVLLHLTLKKLGILKAVFPGGLGWGGVKLSPPPQHILRTANLMSI